MRRRHTAMQSYRCSVLSCDICFGGHRPSLEEADVIQSQVVAQDFIGKRGSAVNVSEAIFALLILILTLNFFLLLVVCFCGNGMVWYGMIRYDLWPKITGDRCTPRNK